MWAGKGSGTAKVGRRRGLQPFEPAAGLAFAALCHAAAPFAYRGLATQTLAV